MRNITIESTNGSFNYSLVSSLNGVREKLVSLTDKHSCFYIIDQNVKNLYAGLFGDLLLPNNHFVLEAHEENKSFDSLFGIYDFLLENQADRGSCIVVIGGGITGDTGSFAASTFMRGTKLVHVPTTLLAMVDSSIGGKTGVNYSKYKNFIGSFYEPETVITSAKFLETLPEEDLLSGMGEVLKYALLEKDFFEYCFEKLDGTNNIPEEDLIYLISRSANIKNHVVTQDKLDLKMRHALNLGHTFGHAIESVSSFGIKHGIGVIAGMRGAAFLANRMGIMSKSTFDKVVSFLCRYPVKKTIADYDSELIYTAMQGDKKRVNGEVKFVLIGEPGDLHIDVSAKKSDVIDSINFMKSTV